VRRLIEDGLVLLGGPFGNEFSDVMKRRLWDARLLSLSLPVEMT
jgi:hypothetical protein